MKSLEAYEISLERGFLPSHDPISRLPVEFEQWERVADILPGLILTGRARQTIEQLPLLNIELLQDRQQLKRAFLLCCIFGSVYVWGNSEPATIIPYTLAIPWWRIAEKLGLNPIICHQAMVIDNWRRLDLKQPVSLTNIIPQTSLMGGLDEQWFFTIPMAMEAKGAPAIISLIELEKHLVTQQTARIIPLLNVIASSIREICNILTKISDKCDPYIFYHRLRPLFAGWPDSGIIYQGVSNTPYKFVGGSGTQSPLLQALDIGLGITYQEEQQRQFFRTMRSYMLSAHRQFLADLATIPSLREFVLHQQLDHPQLGDAYNNCISGLENLRREHLKIAATYIARYAPKQSKGTSGTNFTFFLKEVRQNTKAHQTTVE